MNDHRSIEKTKIERYRRDDFGESYDKRYAGGINSLNTRVERTFVGRALSDIPQGSLVLDAGCGTGRFSAYLADRFKVVSFDSSIGMLESLREKSSECMPVQGNIFELPFKEGTFAAGVSIHVLFHFPNWPQILENISRLLAPGAPFVFEMRSGEHVNAAERALSLVGMKNIERNTNPATKTQYASCETVEQALDKAGLSLSGVYSYDYAHAYYNKPISGLWERALRFSPLNSLAASIEEKTASSMPHWLAYRSLFVGIKR